MRLSYESGTIIINDPSSVPAYVTFDRRTHSYRAEGYLYSRLKADFPDSEDTVFNDRKVELKHQEKLRSYQKKAVDLWSSSSFSGTVVLPTAAGKTHIGIEAMSRLSTTTLVVAPTIELVQQWRERLQKSFGIEVGQIGGGEKDVKDVSVSTYDSAYLMAEKLGNRFKFLLVDEVHHLAAERYVDIARMFASPYRMGLTATYERTDMLHERLQQFMGGKVFELGYEELTEFLADYEIIRIPVELEQEEEEEYNRNRMLFLNYLRKHRMRMRGPWDFERFILSSWNPEGREALIAWRKSRSIAFNSRVKVDTVRYVLSKHRGEKTIIFSEDTNTSYLISKEFLIPCITYLTPGPERKEYLDMFRRGDVTAIATSRVLDEGVDVPDASIGIILSGSGSTRQFRQRLGRLLRPSSGKKATLYEIVASGTSEFATSKRRRKGVPDSADVS
ncbi:MAG: DEAD/DEAH box helicase family protein [Thermoplasmatales archaeon]|jgi:superfamily II DNA or RNA helicase